MGLKENVNSFYEYLSVLASHAINPLIIPPHILREVLIKVKEEMKHKPRLNLPYDPHNNIWAYYSIMKVTPVVQDNFLLVILTIPLIDTSISMNVYQEHNLPNIDPDIGVLGVQFTYQMEGKYLAIREDGLYAAVPSASDICLCMATRGYLCMLNQALCPVKDLDWCIFSLFQKDHNNIMNNCLVDSCMRHANLAINLQGYLWAISSLATEILFLHCIKNMDVQIIHPPLTIVYICNRCEAYSNQNKIPAQSELTSQNDDSER